MLLTVYEELSITKWKIFFQLSPNLGLYALLMNVPMKVDKMSMHRIDFTRFIILAVMRTAAGSSISEALGFPFCEVQTYYWLQKLFSSDFKLSILGCSLYASDHSTFGMLKHLIQHDSLSFVAVSKYTPTKRKTQSYALFIRDIVIQGLMSTTDFMLFLFQFQLRQWKKNLLRTFLVLSTAGIAIALKRDFAFVSAIVGSVGSSTLGFILPCVFHLVLCKETNTRLIKAKDCLLIAFGLVGGVVGLTVTIMQIVEQFSKT